MQQPRVTPHPNSPIAGNARAQLPLKPSRVAVRSESSEAQQAHSSKGNHGASPGERSRTDASTTAGGDADVRGRSCPSAPAEDKPQLAHAQRRPSDLHRCDWMMISWARHAEAVH